jgi:hypothetical protein
MPTRLERLKGSESKLLLAVVVVNLVLMTGIAFHMYEKVRPLRAIEDDGAMLKWGERAPDLGAVASVSGEHVPLASDHQHLTLLFFFDPSMAGEVTSVSSTLHNSHSGAGVRLIGIFRGTGDAWRGAQKSEASGLIVVPDPQGDLHRHFRVATGSSRGATLAITRAGEIRLSVDSIVTPELLSDFIDRQLGSGAERREVSS